ncbi:hypothetical protein E2C01_097605 [Portunus trituberculatus]|uniref:Uncharacterized protein n=1 Tax=Portunus trituberculatus TaxID=210409 RepID=A0A5B7JZ24_PORTR|nr:hypothetical protein [Portunus trituberculatus]
MSLRQHTEAFRRKGVKQTSACSCTIPHSRTPHAAQGNSYDAAQTLPRGFTGHARHCQTRCPLGAVVTEPKCWSCRRFLIMPQCGTVAALTVHQITKG